MELLLAALHSIPIRSFAFRLVLLLLRSSLAVRAENLVLRKPLAQYIERRVKPRRVDSVARISLALLTRWFDWRNAIAYCPEFRSTHAALR